MKYKLHNSDFIMLFSGIVAGLATSFYFGKLMGIPGYITGALVGFYGIYAITTIVYKTVSAFKRCFKKLFR
jgi:hypothetical protein